MPLANLANQQRRLLRWFEQHRRDLPWRRDRDPYRIWVSEVMLQQTQVATVVPYFLRFVEAFPTLTHLAAAAEEEVLRLWAGLGYYRRARDLHRAARILTTEHGVRFPRDADVWRSLPGVGRYILGAVLSQAFDQRLPIIEANSQRVLCRLFAQTADPRRGPTRRWLWQTAEAILPNRGVGEFNQALMELGSLICTPRAPRCSACPLAKDCETRRLGLQEQIPPPAVPPPTVQVKEAAVVVRRKKTVLLVQRPEHGRWANLWEFPHGPLQDSESFEEAADRLLPELTSLKATRGPELLTVRHGVTRFRITLVCFEAKYLSGRFRSTFYQDARWVNPTQLGSFPISSPQRRLAAALLDG
jgi:A/G-specific adenine glycosylase